MNYTKQTINSFTVEVFSNYFGDEFVIRNQQGEKVYQALTTKNNGLNQAEFIIGGMN